MIRLATVFSGIGAIEHALQRMQIKNEIIFACDNGDVSILTKKIDMNIDEIGNELKALSKIIKKIQFNDEVEDLYKNQLDGMLAEALNEYEIVLSKIDSFPKQDSKLIEKILKNVISMKGVKASRVKEYKKFLADLSSRQNLENCRLYLRFLMTIKKIIHLRILEKILNLKVAMILIGEAFRSWYIQLTKN